MFKRDQRTGEPLREIDIPNPPAFPSQWDSSHNSPIMTEEGEFKRLFRC